MNIVNETVDLINSLFSVVDDSQKGAGHGGILGITINGTTGGQVQMDTPEFLKSFSEKNYDAKLETFDEYPYHLSIEVEDVKFYTIFCHAEFSSLEESHPEHYEYIGQAVLL